MKATLPPNLPALDRIDGALLRRTVAFYLARPRTRKALWQTATTSAAIALARRCDFMLFADECYSEIYSDVRAPGALERRSRLTAASPMS
jgi:aspartate/methionine/tyrosine aminotransferase